MRELLFVLIATRPEFQSPKRCRKMLVGPMRRFLLRHDGKELSGRARIPARAHALIGERLAAAEALAEFCARCGRCPDGKILE